MLVTIVDNGREAVASATGEKFDAILMDMHMPEMNGYEATSILRQKGVITPIIALTASTMNNDEEACIEVGCDAYLPKPGNAGELQRRLGE